MFRNISQSEWQSLRGHEYDLAALKKRADQLVAVLSAVLKRDGEFANDGVVVSSPSRTLGIADVVTVLGKGRLKFLPYLDGNQLKARIVVEREMLDSYDKTFWEVTWGFEVSKSGPIFFGVEPSHSVDPNAYDAPVITERAHALGMCIQYAIYAGPATD